MAAGDDDGFIGLPPGFDDLSALQKPSVVRPPAERSEIVFRPTVPGMPVAAPTPSDPVVELPGTPPPAEPRGAWQLVLADGSRVAVDSAVILGRNPAAFDAWPAAVLLPVNDTTHSVSKTHAAFEVDGSGLWVHDLNSTNGVCVVHDDDVTEVAPGRRVNVPVGASVELGDYVLSVARSA